MPPTIPGFYFENGRYFRITHETPKPEQKRLKKRKEKLPVIPAPNLLRGYKFGDVGIQDLNHQFFINRVTTRTYPITNFTSSQITSFSEKVYWTTETRVMCADYCPKNILSGIQPYVTSLPSVPVDLFVDGERCYVGLFGMENGGQAKIYQNNQELMSFDIRSSLYCMKVQNDQIALGIRNGMLLYNIQGTKKFIKSKSDVMTIEFGHNSLTLGTRNGSVILVDTRIFKPRKTLSLSKAAVCGIKNGYVLSTNSSVSKISARMEKTTTIIPGNKDSFRRLGITELNQKVVVSQNTAEILYLNDKIFSLKAERLTSMTQVKGTLLGVYGDGVLDARLRTWME